MSSLSIAPDTDSAFDNNVGLTLPSSPTMAPAAPLPAAPLPAATLPAATLPAATLPAATLPAASLPAASFPAAPLPTIPTSTVSVTPVGPPAAVTVGRTTVVQPAPIKAKLGPWAIVSIVFAVLVVISLAIALPLTVFKSSDKAPPIHRLPSDPATSVSVSTDPVTPSTSVSVSVTPSTSVSVSVTPSTSVSVSTDPVTPTSGGGSTPVTPSHLSKAAYVSKGVVAVKKFNSKWQVVARGVTSYDRAQFFLDFDRFSNHVRFMYRYPGTQFMTDIIGAVDINPDTISVVPKSMSITERHNDYGGTVDARSMIFPPKDCEYDVVAAMIPDQTMSLFYRTDKDAPWTIRTKISRKDTAEPFGVGDDGLGNTVLLHTSDDRLVLVINDFLLASSSSRNTDDPDFTTLHVQSLEIVKSQPTINVPHTKVKVYSDKKQLRNGFGEVLIYDMTGYEDSVFMYFKALRGGTGANKGDVVSKMLRLEWSTTKRAMFPKNIFIVDQHVVETNTIVPHMLCANSTTIVAHTGLQKADQYLHDGTHLVSINLADIANVNVTGYEVDRIEMDEHICLLVARKVVNRVQQKETLLSAFSFDANGGIQLGTRQTLQFNFRDNCHIGKIALKTETTARRSRILIPLSDNHVEVLEWNWN